MSRSLALAWLVHLYTALGAVVGFFSILDIEQGAFRDTFFLMGLAVVIDATGSPQSMRNAFKTCRSTAATTSISP